MRFAQRALLITICWSSVAGVSSASDGVVEINQVKAEAGNVTPADAPGFPVLITQPGSYRLTSSLSVPAGVHGITISAADVTLDLGGFQIASTYSCCGSTGTGSGIVSSSSRVTVANGQVAGFGESGVKLGAFSHVERVLVRQVGEHGIELGNGGLALANRVNQVGGSGLRFIGNVPGMYRDNVLSGTAQASGSTATALAGLAHASGGNYCEDASCSTRGARRYYLTRTWHTGSEAPTACDAGFHFASMHEILDVSTLEYDGRRGLRLDDASVPGGPPSRPLVVDASWTGWIRTGAFSSQTQVGGVANCSGWTTASSTAHGTIAWFYYDWSADPLAPARWSTGTSNCAGTGIGVTVTGVWCVEN